MESGDESVDPAVVDGILLVLWETSEFASTKNKSK